MRVKKFLLRVWEFLFDPWEITIFERGAERWNHYPYGPGIDVKASYSRNYIEYKYTHKFYKKEKIVKEYLN